MVYTRNWISFTEKASFFAFRSKKCLNPCEDKSFFAILWLFHQLLSFLLVSVTHSAPDKKAHFVWNFNIVLIGKCFYPFEENKSST